MVQEGRPQCQLLKTWATFLDWYLGSERKEQEYFELTVRLNGSQHYLPELNMNLIRGK